MFKRIKQWRNDLRKLKLVANRAYELDSWVKLADKHQNDLSHCRTYIQQMIDVARRKHQTVDVERLEQILQAMLDVHGDYMAVKRTIQKLKEQL